MNTQEKKTMYGRNTWALSTYTSNVNMINSYIDPYLGQMKLHRQRRVYLPQRVCCGGRGPDRSGDLPRSYVCGGSFAGAGSADRKAVEIYLSVM